MTAADVTLQAECNEHLEGQTLRAKTFLSLILLCIPEGLAGALTVNRKSLQKAIQVCMLASGHDSPFNASQVWGYRRQMHNA